MDDFEKKELENGSEELAENDKAEALASDELVKELEEIRDMFQEAIDNAAQEESEGEIIQELEDVETENEEEEVVERPLCECCGEKPSSAVYGEDYPYCEECRELMKHYPLRIGGVIAIFSMIIIFALSAYFGYGGIEKTIDILDAQANAKQGKMISTLNTLYSYMSADQEDSEKISELFVDAFCRSGYISDAKDYIESIYSEDELESFSKRKYKEIVEKTERFMATQQATENIVYMAFRGEEFDYDELSAKLDEIKESYIDEENGIKYESALIEYYKVELMDLSGKSLEEQLEVLKGIEADDESGFYQWMYLSSLCEVAAKMGDKELAESYFEKMKKLNSEDMNAYKAYASYFRFLETPDADSMIKLAEDAGKNAQSGDYSYYTIMVTAYLIKGEGALAYDTMREYMSSSRYTVSDCNLYALCALYCGNTETYETMKSTLEGAGYEISELVEKYRSGEMTLAQVLADMGGDLG